MVEPDAAVLMRLQEALQGAMRITSPAAAAGKLGTSSAASAVTGWIHQDEAAERHA
jgi:hypothetical protein